MGRASPVAGRREKKRARSAPRQPPQPSEVAPDPAVGVPVSVPRMVDFGSADDLGASAHYADARFYHQSYSNRFHDVEHYVELGLAARGTVLEYGIGNGRVALPLARAGVSVWGIDRSRPMLDDLEARLARERPAVRARIRFQEGDMRAVRLRQRFALVIAPFNVILHLYQRRDLEAFLACVRHHLARRARFVFDFSIPVPSDLARDPEQRYAASDLKHPLTGERVTYAERFEYDPLRQLLLVRMEYAPESGSAFTVPLTHRQYFPREMEALLHYNGFEDILFTADFSDQPADRFVDSIVVSCRAASSKRPPGLARRPGAG